MNLLLKYPEQRPQTKVVLIINNGFRSCKCVGWKKHVTCKRMFAISKKGNGLDCNSFSGNYRNSLLACLDIKSQILNIFNEVFPICENENPKPVFKKD